MEDMIVDMKNYDPFLPVIERNACKAFIKIGDKFLFLKSNRNDIKLIGGGIFKGEDKINCLIREIKEETGYTAIKNSIKYLCNVKEIRKSIFEEAIIKINTSLYICDVDISFKEKTKYTETEKLYDYNLVKISLDEAIKLNEKALDNEVVSTWVYRDLQILRKIKEKNIL